MVKLALSLAYIRQHTQQGEVFSVVLKYNCAKRTKRNNSLKLVIPWMNIKDRIMFLAMAMNRFVCETITAHNVIVACHNVIYKFLFLPFFHWQQYHREFVLPYTLMLTAHAHTSECVQCIGIIYIYRYVLWGLWREELASVDVMILYWRLRVT